MPKVVIGNEQRKKEKQLERFDYFRGMVDGELTRKRLKRADMANKLDMKYRTFSAKLECPERIGLDELYQMMDFLGVKIVFKRKEAPD